MPQSFEGVHPRMELYLLQHGLTDWNAKRWSQGHVDVPLNETGRAQAEALADRLGKVAFDAIYASDMSRTAESVAPLANRLGLEIRRDWRLREGRWPHQRKNRGDHAVLPFFVSEETHEDVLRRLVRFLDELVRDHPGDQRILVMTHGSVLTRLIFHLEQFSDWPFPPARMQKMAVNVLRTTPTGGWEAVVFNGDEHLTRNGLAIGRTSRLRRRRLIAWSAGVAARTILPTALHPSAQRLVRALVDKDRKLAENPYQDMRNMVPDAESPVGPDSLEPAGAQPTE